MEVMGSEAKCLHCERKRIVRSYMKICDPCGLDKLLCVKCGEDISKGKEQCTINPKELKESMNEYMKELRERSRRTVLRKLGKNQIRWYSDKQGTAVLSSTKTPTLP
jgi:hypothetical protein